MCLNCPQYPDKCCLCLPRRAGVVLTGILSIICSTMCILCCVYVLEEPTVWKKGYVKIESWLLTNKWDKYVTDCARDVLRQVSDHKLLFLSVIFGVASIDIVNSFLLILGSCLRPSSKQRLFYLPWMVLDMFFLVFNMLLYVAWAFLSFFVHILVAIFFPVLSGAILGLWIYMWRNVRSEFVSCGLAEDAEVKNRASTVYRKLPPTAPQHQRHQTYMGAVV